MQNSVKINEVVNEANNNIKLLLIMWHEVLYRVLSIINYIVLIIFAIPLSVQFLEVIIALVTKKRKFPKSEKKAKIAFLIPAHNEEDVIFSTVKDILENQDYPKELITVYVVADNCTDKTAELAKEAGANILTRFDDDPNHKMALFPSKMGIDYILKNLPDVELIVHCDADNHFNKEFSSKMNDAYQHDGDFFRPFEGAINGAQNTFTRACSFFYCYDSRYCSRAREKMGIAQHINGSGATMSRRLLLKTNGYDVENISDDTDFCLNRILDGTKMHFVEEAIVYEDMPSTGKDTVNRNKRIAQGGQALMKQKVGKMFFLFFKTGRFSYLETFFTYIWLFIGAPLFIWLAFYYIYFGIYSALVFNGTATLSMFTTEYFASIGWGTMRALVIFAGFTFVIFGIVQSFVLAVFEYDKFGAKKRSQFVSLIFLFPVYLIIYAFTILGGFMSKKGNKWEKIKRNS